MNYIVNIINISWYIIYRVIVFIYKVIYVCVFNMVKFNTINVLSHA